MNKHNKFNEQNKKNDKWNTRIHRIKETNLKENKTRRT